jgi:hypothetical protein
VVERTGEAAAVWAPSGLSIDFESFGLGDAFFRSVYERAEPTLGEAPGRVRRLPRGGGTPLTPTLYNLLGDLRSALK